MPSSLKTLEKKRNNQELTKNILDFLHYLKNSNILIMRPEHIYKFYNFKTGHKHKKKVFLKALSSFTDKGYLRSIINGEYAYYQIILARFKIEKYTARF